MATTTYLELDDQATGANNNTWGDVADANFAILEQAIARTIAIATTGGTTTLTSAQNRYPIIRLTGVLASNATIVVRTAEKNWTFINATTGAFTVTVKTLSGTGKTLPRGRAVQLYCDGTNVEHVRWIKIPSAQAGGTVDAITATFEPATVSGELQDGTMFLVEAAGANTSTTPTFNPDGLGALTIAKNGGVALVAGDIRAAGHKLLLCYDASSTRYELLNPALQNLGTADSPQFASIELGNASDTTISRVSAGVAAIEGKTIALNGTAEVLTTGSINLGHASDTTITRLAAGVVQIEGFTVAVADPARFHTASFYQIGSIGGLVLEQIDGNNAAIDGIQVTGAGALGYAAGSGGTVTQFTSKATGVTLNKTNGQITMNAAALAATTPVVFNLINSTIAATDTVILNIANSVSGAQNYQAWVGGVSAGSCSIVVLNRTAGSLSDAVVLNFAVIKAFTS